MYVKLLNANLRKWANEKKTKIRNVDYGHTMFLLFLTL